MRPQQQNRRMRGRGNNRKGPNPLTRSYESNGPDVKIRGTAQQIADKYAALARDAQSSGDRVMAENYLQHAEHYNRLIAAAMAQMQPQQRERVDDLDDIMDREDDELAVAPVSAQPQKVDDGSGPQPVIEGTPAEVAYQEQPVAERQVNGSGRAKANGHKAANGQAESETPESEKAEAPATTEAPAAEVAAEESAPKPKRTRRTRTRKTESAAPAPEAGEVPVAAAEEAAAQS